MHGVSPRYARPESWVASCNLYFLRIGRWVHFAFAGDVQGMPDTRPFMVHARNTRHILTSLTLDESSRLLSISFGIHSRLRNCGKYVHACHGHPSLAARRLRPHASVVTTSKHRQAPSGCSTGCCVEACSCTAPTSPRGGQMRSVLALFFVGVNPARPLDVLVILSALKLFL